MSQRPLSPHLTVYRFGYTMLLSFTHRASGLALAVGLLALAWWLMAAAQGPASYGRAVALLAAGPVQVLLALWLLAFLYHFANGIRHLCWDIGLGLEKAQARRSAAIVVVCVVAAALCLIYLFFFAASGGGA